jgi:hypothetical protein
MIFSCEQIGSDVALFGRREDQPEEEELMGLARDGTGLNEELQRMIRALVPQKMQSWVK